MTHVSEQTWWKAWNDNRHVHNEVAHEGRSVTPAEAARSIELAERYMAQVLKTAAGAAPATKAAATPDAQPAS